MLLVLSLAVTRPLCAQTRDSSARSSRILLIMPFENTSKVPGIDSTTALIEYLAATEKDKARPSRVEAQRIVDQRGAR